MLVVDDHHLFAALAGQAAPAVMSAFANSEVFTTSGWYYRLARAANDTTFIGALTRRIEALDPRGRELVLDQIDHLPEEVGLLPARILVLSWRSCRVLPA